MSSDSGLDDPNDQLEDTEVAEDAPNAMDDLFGDGDMDDEPTETIEPPV